MTWKVTNFIKYFIVPLSLITALLLTSCSKKTDDFPDLVFPDDISPSLISDMTDPFEEDAELHELTLALPLSYDTANLLMKLFYAKENGLFPDDKTGADISIEYLEALESNMSVNLIGTSGTGINLDSLMSLYEDDIRPDIILTSDMRALAAERLIEPLDSFLSMNDAIYSSSVYLGEIESLRSGNNHFGIPFYVSVSLIAGNREYLPDGEVPSYNMSEDELVDFISDIPDRTSDNDYVTRFFIPESSVRSLPEGPAADLQDRITQEGFDIYPDSYGSDPRISRSCAMWIMDTSEFDMWSGYYPEGLCFTMIPGDKVYSTVYPLAVCSSCRDPGFAARFSSFICFDEDAQMLIRRLEPLRGFLPPVSSPSVWDLLSEDESWGLLSMLYGQYMRSSVFICEGE